MTLLSNSDLIKITVLIVAFIGLYGLSRWASRQTEAVPPPPEPPELPLSSQVIQPRFRPNTVPIDSNTQIERTKEFSESELEPIRVRNTYFRTFDFLPGPPDSAVFADELLVELYNADTGHEWTSSYLVASPDGITEMLDREHWQYAYADQVFLVKRYDTRVIRQAVLEHLISNQEKPKQPEQEADKLL